MPTSSVCKKKAIPIIDNNIITSATRSATIVPKAFSNGIFSYFFTLAALAISPDLGINKFNKYAIKTAITLFANLGLYPKGSKRKCQRYALDR